MIADSHCHLDYPDLYNHLDDVVRRADYNNVKYMLTILTNMNFNIRLNGCDVLYEHKCICIVINLLSLLVSHF